MQIGLKDCTASGGSEEITRLSQNVFTEFIFSEVCPNKEELGHRICGCYGLLYPDTLNTYLCLENTLSLILIEYSVGIWIPTRS